MADVAVVGLGPAGRALASRLAARGASVLAVDPRPEAVWSPTYGAWADELGSPPEGVVRSLVRRPEIRARGHHVLPREYAVLDNAALQRALPLAGVEVRAARLSDREVMELHREADVVVDARGARPAGDGGDAASDAAPAQTAFGIVVPADDAAPVLDGAQALLMDWRTDWVGDEASADGPPTFLYGIPLGDGTVLLEETCLAAAPGLPVEVLRTRLRRRLLARGAGHAAFSSPLGQEVVRIPMRGRGRPAPPGVLAVGTAGRGGNVVTGYSVAHALLGADGLAKRLVAGERPRQVDPRRPGDLAREAGLRALLNLDVGGTLDLFDAFGRMPARRQRDFFSRETGAGAMAASMWGMFTRLPPRSQLALARATLGRS